MRVSNGYAKSCLNFRSYPINLIHKSTCTYPTALKSYQNDLDSSAADLFVGDENQIELPIRDLGVSEAVELEKSNLHTAARLTTWLGMEISTDPTPGNVTVTEFAKKDPKCRLIYLHGKHSRAPLKITRDMMAQIFTYHQVMPAYLDFLSVFGAQSDARDLRFSGFREQTTLSGHLRGLAVPELGRSGRQYQLCYNLKGIALKFEDKENPRLNEWSIRQTAIHHQFDVEEGTTLWIVTKGSLDLMERYKQLTGKDARPEDKAYSTASECFRSSLTAHLTFCYWSTENWRKHILWLERVLQEETFIAISDMRGPDFAPEYLQPHVKDLQQWEDKVNEVIMALETNAELLSSLRRFYKSLPGRKDFPNRLKSVCGVDIQTFGDQIEQMKYDFQMQLSHAKLLVKITVDRKELVIQNLQAQAAERTERLTQNMEREAIVIRIITIVTLIYLPATFVSTFFSTDVVKYQGQDGMQGSYSAVAMRRWLEVALPLTALTLFAAFSGFRFAAKGRDASARLRKMNIGDWASARAWTRQLMNPSRLPIYDEEKVII